MIWPYEAALAGTLAIPELMSSGFVVFHLEDDIDIAIWAMKVRSKGDGFSISEERVKAERVHCKGGDILICDSGFECSNPEPEKHRQKISNILRIVCFARG